MYYLLTLSFSNDRVPKCSRGVVAVWMDGIENICTGSAGIIEVLHIRSFVGRQGGGGLQGCCKGMRKDYATNEQRPRSYKKAKKPIVRILPDVNKPSDWLNLASLRVFLSG